MSFTQMEKSITKEKVMNYAVYNHNNTLIGEFATIKEAFEEGQKYHYHTGNAYFIEEIENED
jgi:hypothetical protein